MMGMWVGDPSATFPCGFGWTSQETTLSSPTFARIDWELDSIQAVVVSFTLASFKQRTKPSFCWPWLHKEVSSWGRMHVNSPSSQMGYVGDFCPSISLEAIGCSNEELETFSYLLVHFYPPFWSHFSNYQHFWHTAPQLLLHLFSAWKIAIQALNSVCTLITIECPLLFPSFWSILI